MRDGEAVRAGLQRVPTLALHLALDGPIAGKRIYSDTTRIWNSRFFPALDNWVWKGKITREEANYVATLPMSERIKRVMIWEASGYYFSTNFTISIFNSVANSGDISANNSGCNSAR